MEKYLFYNLDINDLTQKQKEIAEEKYGEVVWQTIYESGYEWVEEILAPKNIEDEIEMAAAKFALFLMQTASSDNMNGFLSVFHLPIGSPAFMWALQKRLEIENFSKKREFIIVFSYFEEDTIYVNKKDGSVEKKKIKKFLNFIEFKI